jgi:hypothetical protein
MVFSIRSYEGVEKRGAAKALDLIASVQVQQLPAMVKGDGDRF